MTLRLIQLKTSSNARCVAAADDDGSARRIDGVTTTYELARAALTSGKSLADAVAARLSGDRIDLTQAANEGRLLAPIDHPDTAHLYLTGTGLTHLGSAEGRDKMHKAAQSAQVTDSMRMFMMGVEGGKPAAGAIGAQPEWFYKGDGSSVIGSGAPLPSPAFALDGSEEPEIAGIYLIDDAGNPRRLGFCLANEFSDHVVERGNYLWLAHSKLRAAALGPELLAGGLPDDVRGTSRLLRNGEKIWEKPFLTGEANMSHSLRNLEHHHFKYALFRRPGDVHVHFFGTATLSFADGVRTQEGDVFEISAPPFRLPLRNKLTTVAAPDVAVTQL
ncbi:MAG TPA: AraD1 family protein [Povalibacter sp.]